METVRKTVLMPKGLLDEILEFQKKYYITSFTGAVIELIRRALEDDKKED